MDARVDAINRAVKAHDRFVFCKRDRNGIIQLYRQETAWECFDFEGTTLSYSRVIPKSIFALTHNWSATGQHREWGIEPVVQRLKEIDGYNRDLVEELWKQDVKDREQKEKDRKNKNEDWAYENHAMFKKAFADINTSNLKTDRRR